MALYFEREIETNLKSLLANKGTYAKSVIMEDAGKVRRRNKRKNKHKKEKSHKDATIKEEA